MDTPTRDQARDNSWFSLDNPLDKLTPRAYHNIGFDAGARWAILAGSELSPYVSRFIEMLILIGIAEQNPPLFPDERHKSNAKCELPDHHQGPCLRSFSDITPQIEYWRSRENTGITTPEQPPVPSQIFPRNYQMGE